MVDRRPKVAIEPGLRDEIDAWKTRHKVRCRADAVAALVRRALLIEYAEESGIPVPTNDEILRVLLEQLQAVPVRGSAGIVRPRLRRSSPDPWPGRSRVHSAP
jgi:hypothetical protein